MFCKADRIRDVSSGKTNSKARIGSHSAAIEKLTAVAGALKDRIKVSYQSMQRNGGGSESEQSTDVYCI